MKRGEIWLVNMDPAIGHEIKKTRPAVIVQNDVGNRFSPTTIVAPLTTKGLENVLPIEIFLKRQQGISADSKIQCDKIKCLDKQRLIKRLCLLKDTDIARLNIALRISLAL